MEKDQVLEKIRLLLNLAGGTSSQAEAAAAMAKVQELLFKYNLEMAEVEARGSVESQPYTREFVEVNGLTMRSTWQSQLYHVMATHNFCKVVVSQRDEAVMLQPKPKMVVIGKPANIEVVCYSCAWLMPRMEQMAEIYWQFYPGDEKERDFKAGFLWGCVNGINLKLREQKRRLEEENNVSRALVSTMAVELKDALKQWYPLLSNMAAGNTGGYSGREAGRGAGYGMDIQPGVKGSSIRRLKGG